MEEKILVDHRVLDTCICKRQCEIKKNKLIDCNVGLQKVCGLDLTLVVCCVSGTGRIQRKALKVVIGSCDFMVSNVPAELKVN